MQMTELGTYPLVFRPWVTPTSLLVPRRDQHIVPSQGLIPELSAQLFCADRQPDDITTLRLRLGVLSIHGCVSFALIDHLMTWGDKGVCISDGDRQAGGRADTPCPICCTYSHSSIHKSHRKVCYPVLVKGTGSGVKAVLGVCVVQRSLGAPSQEYLERHVDAKVSWPLL